MATPGADIPALASALTSLHARRAALESAPDVTTTQTVATGESFAEAWEARDTTGRRKLLSSALRGGVVVRPALRGSRKLDESRLDIPWRWNEDDYLEADYDD